MARAWIRSGFQGCEAVKMGEGMGVEEVAGPEGDAGGSRVAETETEQKGQWVLEVGVWAKRREWGFQRWPFSQRRNVDIDGRITDLGFRGYWGIGSLSDWVIERREDGKGMLTMMGNEDSSSYILLV